MGSSVDKIYMVMEYLENDLKACMDMSKSPFSVSEVRRLIYKIIVALTRQCTFVDACYVSWQFCCMIAL